MINLNNIKNSTNILIYICIGVFVFYKGADYYPDSYAFLNMDFNRSPIYNLFLKIFTSIFGDYYRIPVVLVQYIFIVLGTHYLLKTIAGIFKINVLSKIIIQFIILAPCVYLHFVANRVLSEAISYPMILLLISLCLKLFVEENLKYVYKIIPLVFILILTRGQFIAFIPVILILGLYVAYKNKYTLKRSFVLGILLILPFFTSLTEKIYNKVVYDQFVNNTMNYVHLISASFYVSEKEDIAIFDTQDQKEYFKIIYNSLFESELTRSQAIDLEEDDYQYFQENFTKICNARVHELGLKYFENRGLNYYEQSIALNNLCADMLLPMIKHSFKVRAILLFKNVKNAFGTTKQLLLFIMLLIYGLVYLWKTNENIYKFFVVTILLMFANNTIIALAVHSIKRYVFYFDWVIFALIILLLNEILIKKQLNEY